MLDLEARSLRANGAHCHKTKTGGGYLPPVPDPRAELEVVRAGENFVNAWRRAQGCPCLRVHKSRTRGWRFSSAA